MLTNDAAQESATKLESVAQVADEEYRHALARLAQEAGLDPDEFERRVMATAAKLELTPQCLTLDDIEHFPTLASLPQERQQHVSQCAGCTEFLKAISPRPDEVDRFVVSVASPGASDPHPADDLS
jgi:hypothetical protein